MSLIRRQVEREMTRGDRATRRLSSPFEWSLYGCSRAYELAVAVRIHLYQKRFLHQKGLPCKVVSVGNITVGGTGKTPMVCYVARLLQRLGLEVAVISRGYGGQAQDPGGIVSDGRAKFMGPGASGDEPQLLASKLQGVPVLVGKNRYRVGRLAIKKFDPAVLILDDGFQHLPLKRDLDLLLLDSMRPFGNGCLLPRGTLREPVEQVKRASALVLTRWTDRAKSLPEYAAIEEFGQYRPVFRCMHVPEGLFVAGEKRSLPLAQLAGRRLLAFSGIGQNHHFRKTIVDLEGRIAGFLEFGDHHRYSRQDLSHVWKRAGELKVENIITTEKDFVNIRIDIPSSPRLLVLAIAISFEGDREHFDSYMKDWALSP